VEDVYGANVYGFQVPILSNHFFFLFVANVERLFEDNNREPLLKRKALYY
jgi:hypothetical protein